MWIDYLVVGSETLLRVNGYMAHPRVLIVTGEPFNSKSATGITVSNLFRGWPKDKIAQIYSADIEPDVDVCEKNWRISNKDLMLLKQLYHFKKGSVSTPMASSVYEAPPVAAFSKKVNAKNTVMRRVLVPLIDLLPYQLSDDHLSNINDFKPDVIYSMLGNIRLVRLVHYLSSRLSIPVVPHFMDDWLSTYSVSGRSLLTTIQRVIINRLTHQVVKNASVGLSIGDAMAEEYSQRFGIPFFAFMNPVALPLIRVKNVSAPKSTTVFIYVGGFHLGRYENLIDIGRAIAKVRQQNINVTFLVYAPQTDIAQYGEDLVHDGVEIRGTIAPEEVQKVLSQANVAVHVESFLEKFSCYTRLSVSTKIPQYYAAALPVLAYGPSGVASCRYVNDNYCGVAVGHKNEDSLEEVIRTLAVDVELRNRLGENALSIAYERHDALKERERFRKVLLQACNGE